MTITGEQMALFPAWRAEWEGVSLETAPADRRRAEDAIVAMYADVALPPPIFIWVGSPLAAGLAAAAIPVGAGCGLWPIRGLPGYGPLRWQYFQEIFDEVPADLQATLLEELGANRSSRDEQGVFPRAAAFNQARFDWRAALTGPSEHERDYGMVWTDRFHSTHDELRGEVRDHLRAQLGEEICARIRYSAPASGPFVALRGVQWAKIAGDLERAVERLPEGMHGQQGTAYRLAAPLYCRDVLGIPCPERTSWRLELYAEIARACGSWWPFSNICIVSERLRAVHWDDEDRLHHPSRPAIEYRDGTGLHLWHGTLVPARWIRASATIDPRLALTWSNIEQRRALAEIIGWGRVIEQLRPTIVDRDPDPAIGTLLDVHLPDFERVRFLRVRCGTGREFVLCVPFEMQTARQANAWTYGLEADQYTLEART